MLMVKRASRIQEGAGIISRIVRRHGSIGKAAPELEETMNKFLDLKYGREKIEGLVPRLQSNPYMEDPVYAMARPLAKRDPEVFHALRNYANKNSTKRGRIHISIKTPFYP
jgi:hypothetical protein